MEPTQIRGGSRSRGSTLTADRTLRLPKTSGARRALQALLDPADVRLDGSRPWDMQVRDPRLYQRVLAEGSLGLGESYVDGWWDCEALDQFFYHVLRARVNRRGAVPWQARWYGLLARLTNRQSKRRAFEVGERHYDLDSDLFEHMLDRRMVYSCAYWARAQTLDEAQEAKLDLICRKVGLEEGMRVLDIGCGWGSFAQYAAEAYGAEVVGITVSAEQAECAAERCAGLPVAIRLMDYRDLEGQYDRVVSIGMFEHVGYKNYRTFFEVVRCCLKPDGLFLLHTIGRNMSGTTVDPWIHKYIFPNSVLPSVQQIAAAAEGLFVLEDWHSFGPHYDRTLMAWYHSFVRGWEVLKGRYDERFYRMWTYYLLCCAGAFRARNNQLWQLVYSREGILGGYRSLR